MLAEMSCVVSKTGRRVLRRCGKEEEEEVEEVEEVEV